MIAQIYTRQVVRWATGVVPHLLFYQRGQSRVFLELSIYQSEAAFGQERTSRLLGFLLSAAFFRVAFVQLDDDLLDRARHCLETPLSAAVNGVGAFKRDHIAVPVGTFRVWRGLCSLDRHNFVDLSHCVRYFSDAPHLTLFAGSSTNLLQKCRLDPYHTPLTWRHITGLCS